MNYAVIFVLFFAQQSSAVIYRLNESAYAALPAFHEVEDYAACRRARGAYCSVDARLVANESSRLLASIQEFSEYNTTHFDRRVVHRGMCTSSCGARGASARAPQLLVPCGALRLEACLNDTLYRTHRLQSKVIEENIRCTEFEFSIESRCFQESLDFLALICCFRLLFCFSLRQNWRRLVAPPAEDTGAGLRRLKCFHGIKLLTIVLVILGHSPLSSIAVTMNPDYFETTYHSPLFSIVYNGSLIVQTFFVLSGFLLSYNVLRQPHVSWKLLPKGTVFRWLRLTPPYAAVLAFACTWQRHVGSGPFWQTMVGPEVRDCRRDWFYSLLYVNNYIDGSQCMPHTWYVVADMQLSVVGLTLLCAARTTRARRGAAAALAALGLLAPAAHIVFQNLNAVLVVTPEVARTIFVYDPTFNNLYKRGHTNLACYAVGLAVGEAVLRMQQQDFDISKYKKYRILYWALVPLVVLLILSGAIFYMDGLQLPLAVRVLYSSAVKILFGFFVSAMIVGCIFKFENTYRPVLEWRGWAAPARAAYCAFLVHVSVIRYSTVMHASLVQSSFYMLFLNYVGILVVSFLLAFPCWLLVEAPCVQLVKVCFTRTDFVEKQKPPGEPTQVVVLGTKAITRL